jgi:predicted MFS family arabinose efflux permease
MSELVEAHGWRTAYLFVAAFVAVAGLLAIALIPGEQAPSGRAAPVEREGVDYGVLLRDRTFQILIAGMLLCNLTLTLQMTQLKIVLLDVGIGAGASSLMISFYGFGVIAGRLFCGVALDRFPPHVVAALAMAAPAIGLFMLASGTLTVPLAGLAIAILGLATGAEGDVGAYLVMRYFRRAIYGSVFGLLMAALSISGAVGALLLSFTLAASGGSFQPFLITAGIAAVIGGGLFVLLGTRSSISEPGAEAPALH